MSDALLRAPDNHAVTGHIRRHGFWYPEHAASFDEPQPLIDAVVESLFEPICRDFARVARAVESYGAADEFTVYDLARRVPGAFLGNVEDALEDLCERGILALDNGRYRWAAGPRDLTEYRSGCAWQGLQGAAA